MSAVVGGRLEELPPRPVTDGGDRTRLLVLLVLAVGLHAWLMNHTYLTARDSVGFARYALRILGSVGMLPPAVHDAAGGAPLASLQDVLKSEKQPPGYPLTVAVAAAAFGPLTPENVHDRMLWCAQLAASAAGVLVLFPTYWLGRTLFGKNSGFAGAALFQLLPVPAHVTSDGLTDGLYLLGVATSLLLGTRALGRPTVGRFLLTGLASGATYLVRPEGLLPGLVAIGVAAFWWTQGRWRAKSLMAWVCAWGVGATLTAAPYMVLIGSVSNKPSVQGIFHKVIDSPRLKLMQGHSDAGAPTAPLAATYVPGVDGGVVSWTAGAIFRETTKGLHYAAAGLALAGLWASRRRFAADPAYGVILAFAALDLVLVGVLGGTEKYVSERHVLPLVFVGCVLAGKGVAVAGVSLARLPGLRGSVPPRYAAIAVLVAVAASALPAAMKPLHEHRAGHRHVGRYVAAHAAPGDTLVDPYEWAIYFSGRGLLAIPADRPDAKAAWVVWVEPSGDPKKDFNPDAPVSAAFLALAQAVLNRVTEMPATGPLPAVEL